MSVSYKPTKASEKDLENIKECFDILLSISPGADDSESHKAAAESIIQKLNKYELYFENMKKVFASNSLFKALVDKIFED